MSARCKVYRVSVREEVNRIGKQSGALPHSSGELETKTVRAFSNQANGRVQKSKIKAKK